MNRDSSTREVGQRGTVVIPAELRRRCQLTEGSAVIAEARDDGILLRPAAVLPLETYSPRRRAEFLLSNAVDAADYAEAVRCVRELDGTRLLTSAYALEEARETSRANSSSGRLIATEVWRGVVPGTERNFGSGMEISGWKPDAQSPSGDLSPGGGFVADPNASHRPAAQDLHSVNLARFSSVELRPAA